MTSSQPKRIDRFVCYVDEPQSRRQRIATVIGADQVIAERSRDLESKLLFLHFPSEPNLFPASVSGRGSDFELLHFTGQRDISLADRWGEIPPVGSAFESFFLGSGDQRLVPLSGRIGEHRQLHAELLQNASPIIVNGLLAGIAVARSQETGFVLAPLSQVPSLVSDKLSRYFPFARTTSAKSSTLFDSLGSAARTALGHAVELARRSGQDMVHMEHLILSLYLHSAEPIRRRLDEAGVREADLLRVLQRINPRLAHDAALLPVDLFEMPAISQHVLEAFAAAPFRSGEDGTLDLENLALGANEVRQCQVIRLLNAYTEQLLEAHVERAAFHPDSLAGPDLLGIDVEVNALCDVIAARDTEPPLSIGLFGDWGSGKSFFMKKMQERLRLLSASSAARSDSPYCSKIVQLTFDAWHYIDTNLWASMTAEIFEGLARELEQDQSESPDKRALLRAASTSREGLLEAEKNQEAAKARLADLSTRLRDLNSRIEKDMSLFDIGKDALRLASDQPEVQEKLNEAAEALNLQPALDAGREAEHELLKVYGLGKAIVLAIRHGRVWLWILAALLFLVVAGFAYPFAMQWITRHDARALSTAIALGLTSVAAFLTPFIALAKRALRFIEAARKLRDTRVHSIRLKKEQEIQSALTRAQAEVDSTQKQVELEQAAIAKLEQEIQDLRAGHKLSEFIRNRYRSSDYAQHLGVIAKAHSDFRRLSILLREARTEADSELLGHIEEVTRNGAERPAVDRIVLYIDDLDRCPEHKVVDVLQAVHLLLAFPLFVVVVGVDSRWLLHSLEHLSPVFGASKAPESNDPSWETTPLNYLEKIFQIPFALRPIDGNGFIRFVDQFSRLASNGEIVKNVQERRSPLGQTSLPSLEPSTSQPSHEGPSSAEKPDKIPTETNGGLDTSLVLLGPQHMRFESWESEFMKTLGPLIPSPRAAKRFINLYRLLRASLRGGDRPKFVGTEDRPGEYAVVQLLLAILTGYPEEAAILLGAVMEQKSDASWWAFVEGHIAAARGKWPDLIRKLLLFRTGSLPSSCEPYIKWAPKIGRYSFRSGRPMAARLAAAANPVK